MNPTNQKQFRLEVVYSRKSKSLTTLMGKVKLTHYNGLQAISAAAELSSHQDVLHVKVLFEELYGVWRNGRRTSQ